MRNLGGSVQYTEHCNFARAHDCAFSEPGLGIDITACEKVIRAGRNARLDTVETVLHPTPQEQKLGNTALWAIEHLAAH